MSAADQGWTEHEINILQKLWCEGVTAAVIGERLGGRSRSAILGKVHRLKLEGRHALPRRTKDSGRARKPRDKKKDAPSAAPPPVRCVIPDSVVVLTDLTRGQCRWPFGDPKEEGFGFCGAGCQGALPYCATHAAIAYPKRSRRSVDQEGDSDDI